MQSDTRKLSLERDFPTQENVCVMANALSLIGECIVYPTQIVHIDMTMGPLMRLVDPEHPHQLRDRMLESLDRILFTAKDHGYYMNGPANHDLLLKICETAQSEAQKYAETAAEYLMTVNRMHVEMYQAGLAGEPHEASYSRMHQGLHQHE